MPKSLTLYQGTGFDAWVIPGRTWLTALRFFTGYYLDPSIEAGHGAGFVWNTEGGPAYLNTRTSGSVVDANVDIPRLSFTWGGNIYPLLKESGNFIFTYNSGAVVKDNIDYPYISTHFSAQVSGFTPDSPNLTCLPRSGSVVSGAQDQPNIWNNISAQVSGFTTDNAYTYVSFSGGFVPPYKDDIGPITMQLTQIYYQDDFAPFKTRNAADTGNISMQLYKVEYSNY